MFNPHPHTHSIPGRFCQACGLVSCLWLPVLALILASSFALGLLGFKIVLSGRWRHLYLAWNLFLAWIPLLCAWKAWRDIEHVRPRNWKSFAVLVLWFLFFPNAPYIVTDLIHLAGSRGGHYWADLILIFFFAVTGLVAGFISLYLMHAVVRRSLGWAAGWGFVGCMAGLSGLGVYLGRFLRWNSWDLLLNPFSLGWDVTKHFASPANHPLALVFPLLFGAFLFASYAMLYGLTYLPRVGAAASLPRTLSNGLRHDQVHYATASQTAARPEASQLAGWKPALPSLACDPATTSLS